MKKKNLTNSQATCLNCFTSFYGLTRHEKLEKHKVDCYNHNAAKITFPKEKTIKFRNIKAQRRCLFSIYSDFESVLIPSEEIDVNKVKPTIETENLPEMDENEEPGCDYLSDYPENAVNQHKISAFSLSCQAPEKFQHLFPPRSFCGPFAGQRYIEELLKYRDLIRKLLINHCNKEMLPLTDREEALYKDCDICHICSQEISCELSHGEYIDTMGAGVFTDEENDTTGKCWARETDMLGPKVR